ETDYRQYDAALGRFNVMDALSEMAPDHTPYRYGFNNPVFWQDKTGLFESWTDAREYQLSNGLFGSSIGYDWDNDYWYIEDKGSTIQQVGNQILKTYQIDSEWFTDISSARGGSGGGGSSNSNSLASNESNSNSNNGFWKFWETGGMFMVYGLMKDDPGYKMNSRKRSAVDASMNYDQVISPAMGSGWLERLKDLVGGLDTRSSTLWEKLNTSESEDLKWFQYDTFKALPPYIIQSKYDVYKVTRDTMMTPTDYNNTDWSGKSIIDSIQAVENAKQKNKQYNVQ